MYGNFSREMSTYSFSTVQMYVRCMSRSFLTGRCPNTRFLRCYGALANQYTIYNSTSLLPHLLCQLFCVTLTQPSFDRLSSWFYAHRGFIHTYSRPHKHLVHKQRLSDMSPTANRTRPPFSFEDCVKPVTSNKASIITQGSAPCHCTTGPVNKLPLSPLGTSSLNP